MISQNKNQGFAALYLTILIMMVILGMTASITILTFLKQKIQRNLVSATQAYYIAEAGIEDILLRLNKNLNWQSSYTLEVNGGQATIEVSDLVGGTRTITSQGEIKNRIRKIQVIFQTSTQEISFYFGAQIGDGGMEIDNNARVKGNVFSNGSVVNLSGAIKGFIDDSIVVARNTNRIEGLDIGEDAKVANCYNSRIEDDLTYVSGGSVIKCSADEVLVQEEEIAPKDLPISQAQIDKWKNEASCNDDPACLISEDPYVISGRTTVNLGPVKFAGDLIVDNQATLNMTGTIWVVGDLTVDSRATIKLDQDVYGSTSGVLIVDGKTKIRPTTYLKGTGKKGSYLMILSTNPEAKDYKNPAIDVDNTTEAAIFYASRGVIVLRNKVRAREITAYRVYLEPNAEIIYEAGLADAAFSSGTGGSWQVASWKEIE
jgi:Tfp pilus assembly protein PilX